jgi:hypothetical protein
MPIVISANRLRIKDLSETLYSSCTAYTTFVALYISNDLFTERMVVRTIRLSITLTELPITYYWNQPRPGNFMHVQYSIFSTVAATNFLKPVSESDFC